MEKNGKDNLNRAPVGVAGSRGNNLRFEIEWKEGRENAKDND